MGVLSDLIIAHRSEAAEINRARGAHLQRWPVLESKGIDTIKLGSLASILLGVPNDGSFIGGNTSILDQPSRQGPWIILVPPELVQAIAELPASHVDEVAEQWGESEEFRLDHWSVEVAREYFGDLAAHCQRAKREGKDLLLWMSL